MAQTENLDSRLSAGDKMKGARNRVTMAGQSVGGAGNKLTEVGDKMGAARNRVSSAGDRMRATAGNKLNSAGNQVSSAGDRVSNAGEKIKGNSTAAGWPGNVESNLDNRLLNPEQESQAAGELRGKKISKEDRGDEEVNGEPESFREKIMQAKQAMNLKEQAKKKLKEKVMAPAKQGLNNLLRQAWINLLDSFGLTLIWINIHVFLKWTLGEDLFCKLGEEWLPKQVTEMAGPGGDAAKGASKGFGLIEVIVLLILDLIVLAVIFGALALLVLIAQIMQASWSEKALAALKIFWGSGWDTLKLLYDLFANLK
ncbi:MAG: hypothetical protein Q7K35_01495 [bacterium]|nr:hypothetical protein [bacterium]